MACGFSLKYSAQILWDNNLGTSVKANQEQIIQRNALICLKNSAGNSFGDNSLANCFHRLYYLWAKYNRSTWNITQLLESHLCIISVTLCEAKDRTFYFQAKYHMAGGTIRILLRSPHLTSSRNYEQILSLWYSNSICQMRLSMRW